MPDPKAFSNKNQDLLIALFLVTAILAVYFQVVSFEFVNFDDPTYITENVHVRGGLTPKGIRWAFTTTHGGNWHPMTWMSHMLDVDIFGMNPGGHHLTNVILHLANTLLLFALFKKLTGNSWRSGLLAGLFALHPLHVESVAWVSERKDVLSFFFGALTMLAYARYVEQPGAGRYFWMALLYSLGLMAKPMLVTLPCVLLLIDFWPLGRIKLKDAAPDPGSAPGSGFLKLVSEKLPLLILAEISCVATFYAEHQGGSVSSLEAVPLPARAANALIAYAAYIRKTVWPVDLAVLYPYPQVLAWWKIAGALIFLAVVTFMTIKRLKSAPYFAFGWLWYLGTLVPVIGLIQIGGQSMADRYTYIPLIGLFVIFAWAIPDPTACKPYKKWGATALATALFVILASLTFRQTGIWANSTVLFENALEKTSGNHVAHNNLGLALAQNKRMDSAVVEFSQALRIKPGYVNAHNNLGLAFRQLGQPEKAAEHFQEAIRLDPDSYKAHTNMGNFLLNEGLIDQAIDHYQQAITIKPDFAGAHNSLGVALFRKGNVKKAAWHFQTALFIDPETADARNNLRRLSLSESRRKNP